MPTRITGVVTDEDKQKFDSLLQAAKTISGNVTAFEFNGAFFKVSRNDSSSTDWRIYPITQLEFNSLSI